MRRLFGNNQNDDSANSNSGGNSNNNNSGPPPDLQAALARLLATAMTSNGNNNDGLRMSMEQIAALARDMNQIPDAQTINGANNNAMSSDSSHPRSQQFAQQWLYTQPQQPGQQLAQAAAAAPGPTPPPSSSSSSPPGSNLTLHQRLQANRERRAAQLAAVQAHIVAQNAKFAGADSATAAAAAGAPPPPPSASSPSGSDLTLQQRLQAATERRAAQVAQMHACLAAHDVAPAAVQSPSHNKPTIGLFAARRAAAAAAASSSSSPATATATTSDPLVVPPPPSTTIPTTTAATTTSPSKTAIATNGAIPYGMPRNRPAPNLSHRSTGHNNKPNPNAPPELPDPDPSLSFFQCKILDEDWTHCEVEQPLVCEIPWVVLQEFASGSTSSSPASYNFSARIEAQTQAGAGGASGATSGDDPLVQVALSKCSPDLRRRVLAQADYAKNDIESASPPGGDSFPQLLNSSQIFCCTCDEPAVVLTHGEWMQHRSTAAHQRTIYALAEARLLSELDDLYDEAERALRTGWNCPGNPLIASGRMSFDTCATHSATNAMCPSWTAVVNSFTEPRWNLKLRDRVFGVHGCRSEAIAPISCSSLDPGRRSGQVYGRGEYCAAVQHPRESISYTRGADRMFLFVIFKNDYLSLHNQNKFLVVDQPTDQPNKPHYRFMLPLLIAAFEPSDAQTPLARVLANESDAEKTAHIMRDRRLNGEWAQLRERAFADGVYARPRDRANFYSMSPEQQHQRRGEAWLISEREQQRQMQIDAREFKKDAIWDFLLLGPPGTPIEGAEILGVMKIPVRFPFEAPTVFFLTPQGRYPIFVDLCAVDATSWSPAASISMLLMSLLAILCTTATARSELGAAACPPTRVRRLADESRAHNDRFQVQFVQTLRAEFVRAWQAGAEAERQRLEKKRLKNMLRSAPSAAAAGASN